MAVGETSSIQPIVTKVLLICGILSTLLYVATDILAAMGGRATAMSIHPSA
jgi:hypothetical protein